jgi:hypothetical protein
MPLSLDTECQVVSPLQRKVDVELAVSYFDPEHYSYRVKLRRRSRRS